MNSTPSPLPAEEDRPSALVDLWGDGISAGFTAIPNALIRAQSKLKLTSNDMVVLLNLLMHRWYRDSEPHPRPASIAKRSGLSVRTVQRSLSHLAELNLIRRRAGPTKVTKSEVTAPKFTRARARYDLTALREQVEAYAVTDVWYRPAVVLKKPAGFRAKEQGGLPNPGP